MSNTATSLQKLHTFGLPVSAERVIIAETQRQLLDAWQLSQQQNQPFLLLGEGSNVLFLDDFIGVVVVNRLIGIQVKESADDWHLHVGAGENWHRLVSYALEHKMYGLENLALIPGCVGSAPIQNIGAYGMELKQVCEYVDLLDLRTETVSRIDAADCAFGYRESIFKHQYRDGYAIVAVGLRLAKAWTPILEYGDLQKLDRQRVTPRQVFDTVCHMRRSKLPDPNVTGNAGSFFKNPIVSPQAAEKIQAEYPNAPCYTQPDGSVKLAAGWLIDSCGLKGYRIGGASVHLQQALVLINDRQALAQDVVALAQYVRQSVADKFGVWLEPEVRFIGQSGERNAVEIIS